ncbi:unnamed protein product [Mycena citricolor]|uniref:Glucose-methanol-choline oxidoreductase N-terminal domain-containing protein n=1 Tax=Mycena citricolor TaxID=2018698 RepID=A0AAD2JXD6_9AGAR|nr:unnamed protein product [Mycena citricolor]
MEFEQSFDIIFAGGGTTACVIAARLSAAVPSLSILIVEDGPDTLDSPMHLQPALFIENMRNPASPTMQFHGTRDASGKLSSVNHGRCVGGSSVINAMIYNRAAASDYDDWARAGNPGWGAEDLIPLAKKLETYQGKIVNDTHGSSGPIQVSPARALGLGADFLDAAAAYPRGRSFTDDLNGFGPVDVYGRWPKYIDGPSGRRSDAANTCLYPRLGTTASNIRIISRARVSAVLFDGSTAVGVEYHSRDPGTVHRVGASKMVVISAGAFCSPAILERSGVGQQARLELLGVPVVAEIPGVGENYNDHIGAAPSYFADESQLTLDGVLENLSATGDAERGVVASNGFDAGIKLRPNDSDLEVLGPGFQPRWESFFMDAPDKSVLVAILAAMSLQAVLQKSDHESGSTTVFSLTYYLCYPGSAGSVHATSTDPYAALDIATHLLTKEEDVLALRWGYKWTRELVRRMASFHSEVPASHPHFADTSAAKAILLDERHVGAQAPEIQYSAEDDRAIDAYHRAVGAATWHGLGTCAMKPKAAGGVVDARLNVYGTARLKVADMSIAPSNVLANTYNTALIIGEKAALIIAEDLGVPLA